MKRVLVLVVLCCVGYSWSQSDDCGDCGCDVAVAPSCNQCLSSCANTCTQPSCNVYCVRRCAPCRNQRPGSCRTSSDAPTKSTNEVKVGSNPVVNISNTIDITNRIDNVNHINIPVDVNSTNINNIVVKVEPKAGQAQKVLGNSSSSSSSSCCMVIPPKQCQYEAGDLRCSQDPYKLCSDTCRTPIVAPHPIPVPVYVPRPYPVPQPVIRHVPVPQVVRVPVPQPMPIPIAEPIPQPQPQRCPTAWYGGNFMPTCSNLRDTRQFVGTSQQFLLDQAAPAPQCGFVNRPPWLQCGAPQTEDCGPCTFCNGQYNPEMCISSPECSPTCRRLLHSTNLHVNLRSQLQCNAFPDGRIQCL